MEFFTSGVFWFIEGILFVSILTSVKYWTEDRQYFMPWWKWSFLIVWIYYCGFTIAFIFTNIGENELTAAFRGGIFFSLIAIVSAVGLYRLLAIPCPTSSDEK